MIKDIFINIIDKSWIEHIQSMEYLRQGIGLRSYAQKNPKQEYKREAFEMFSVMQSSVHYTFISLLFRLDYSSINIKKDLPENNTLASSHGEINLGNQKQIKQASKNARKRSRKLKKKRKK